MMKIVLTLFSLLLLDIVSAVLKTRYAGRHLTPRDGVKFDLGGFGFVKDSENLKKKSSGSEEKKPGSSNIFFSPRLSTGEELDSRFFDAWLRLTAGRRRDVIIGGYGMAGIGAAKVLDQYRKSFVVLEASDHIGGRVHSKEVGGNMIETGALYVSGYGEGYYFDNPIWTAAVREDLDGTEKDFYPIYFYDENGDRRIEEEDYLENSYASYIDEAMNDGVEFTSEFCFLPGEGDTIDDNETLAFCKSTIEPWLGENWVPLDEDDISIEQCLNSSYGWNVSAFGEDEAIARNLQDWYVDLEFGAGVERASTQDWFYDPIFREYKGDFSMFVRDPRGYDWIPKAMAADYMRTTRNTDSVIRFRDRRLRLKEKIIQVDYDNSGTVAVTVCKTVKVEEADKPTMFPCRAGIRNFRKYNADNFISTFSVEVLKKSLELERDGTSLADSINVAPRFNPPLSSNLALAQSLDRNGIGHMHNIYVQFTKTFWNDTDSFLSAASDDTWTGILAPDWTNLSKDKFYPSSGIIRLRVSAERAKAVAKETDEKILEMMLNVLNSIFGENILEVYGRSTVVRSDIIDYHIPRWSEDPLFRGSYAFGWPFGFLSADYNEFIKPKGNWYPSGESVCLEFGGFMQGAYMQGKGTATLILKEQYGMSELDERTMCSDLGKDLPFDYEPF